MGGKRKRPVIILEELVVPSEPGATRQFRQVGSVDNVEGFRAWIKGRAEQRLAGGPYYPVYQIVDEAAISVRTVEVCEVVTSSNTKPEAADDENDAEESEEQHDDGQ